MSSDCDDGRQEFAVWLVPDDPTAKRLRAYIHFLAGLTDSPIFEPHITLVSGTCDEPAILKRKQDVIVANFSRLALTMAEIRSDTPYFQSVYFTLCPSDELQRLQRFCADRLGIKRAWFPHLSLLYSDAPLAAKQRLSARLAIPKEPMIFDRLAVWMPDRDLGWRAVDRWHALG